MGDSNKEESGLDSELRQEPETVNNEPEVIEVDITDENTPTIENSNTEEPADYTSADSSVIKEKSHKKFHKGDIVRYIIMGIAICVFIFAAVQIVRIVRSYKKAQNIYNDIDNKVYSTEDNTGAVAPSDPEINDKYPGINAYAHVDFKELKAINDRIVGWVDVPSVGISYPVVQGDDNDYYLNHTVTGDENWSGAIFLDHRNSPLMDDVHSFIYGHHMQDNSMFASLLEYDSKDFYDKQAENNNNYFYIYLENKIQVYQIFNVCDVTYDSNPETFTIASSYSLESYLADIDKVKLYDTGVTADATDHVVTLYTCQNGSANPERHMVHGKLIATIDQ